MASAASLTGRGPATSIDEKKKERELQRRDEQRLRCEELIRGSDSVAADSAKALGKSLAKHPELLKHTDRLGRTLLHCAAAHGQYDCAELLLAQGASTSAQDKESGWTPLHAALYGGHLCVALQLLQHPPKAAALAALNAVEDKEGFTPLDLLTARRRGTPAVGGDVHCFGSGSNFQLGNAGNDSKVPRRLAALRGYAITQVASSSRHSLFLTDGGQIFATGLGPGGRLGTGNEHTQPTPVPVAKLRHVSYIAAGPSGSAAISGDGNLFMWGRSDLGIAPAQDSSAQKPTVAPKRVSSMQSQRVRQVCLEAQHALVLTTEGSLFAVGESNAHGQLCSDSSGKAGSAGIAAGLRRVSALADVRLRSVASAPKGAVALLEGDADYIYEWGWGSGLPRKVGLLSRKAKAPEVHFHRSHKLSIASASVGNVVLVATVSGEVHSWYPGGGEPRRLELFRDKKVKTVAARDDSCIVLTDFGDLYTWKAKEHVPPPPKPAGPGSLQRESSWQTSPSSSPNLSATAAHHSPSAAPLDAPAGGPEACAAPVISRPPLVAQRPKLHREPVLKQVTAISNGGTHYHVITPLREANKSAADDAAAKEAQRREELEEEEEPLLVDGVSWATYIDGFGDSPYAEDVTAGIEAAFRAGKSRHNFAASFDGGAPQKYTIRFTPLQSKSGEQSFVQTNDAYGTTRPVSRLLDGKYSLDAPRKPFQRREFSTLGVKSLKELCQLSAAANVTYETLLGTYAFALGYEADTLADQCAEMVVHNLESLLIGVVDGSAVSADFEEYLTDLFEAVEMHLEEEDEVEMGVEEGEGSVAHAEQIAELQRKIEQVRNRCFQVWLRSGQHRSDGLVDRRMRTTRCSARWCRPATTTSTRWLWCRCSRTSTPCTRSSTPSACSRPPPVSTTIMLAC